MAEIDYDRFNEVHQEVLSAIAEDYLKGHRLYVDNLDLYDALPENTPNLMEGRLARKLEVCGAVEVAVGCLGVSLSPKEGRTVSSLEAVDSVIRLMVETHESLKNRDQIPLGESSSVH